MWPASKANVFNSHLGPTFQRACVDARAAAVKPSESRRIVANETPVPRTSIQARSTEGGHFWRLHVLLHPAVLGITPTSCPTGTPYQQTLRQPRHSARGVLHALGVPSLIHWFPQPRETIM